MNCAKLEQIFKARNLNLIKLSILISHNISLKKKISRLIISILIASVNRIQPKIFVLCCLPKTLNIKLDFSVAKKKKICFRSPRPNLAATKNNNFIPHFLFRGVLSSMWYAQTHKATQNLKVNIMKMCIFTADSSTRSRIKNQAVVCAKRLRKKKYSASD